MSLMDRGLNLWLNLVMVAHTEDWIEYGDREYRTFRRFLSRGGNITSQPIITPEKWLKRDSLLPEGEGCSVAVVGFCRFYDMKDKLQAEPLSEPIFSHVDPSHQFVGQIGECKILALDCLYGGPMSATVIEELAHYRIKKVIGYGFAGSLTRHIPVGQIVLADAAIVSDGTSHEYLPDDEWVYPNQQLADHLRECATRNGITICGGKVWTTDAIYREYPEKVERWRQLGGEVVNMDTSHFYAVSKVVGISAVYACVISDSVEAPVWDEGFDRIRQATSDLHATVDGESQKYVIRQMPPAESFGFARNQVKPYDLQLEFLALKDLERLSLKTPRVWGLDDRGKFLTRPAFVMEFIEGPTVLEASQENSEQVVRQFTETIWQMNQIPPSDVPNVVKVCGEPEVDESGGVAWMEDQVKNMRLPSFVKRGIEILEQEKPDRLPPSAFGNGDVGPMNFILAGDGSITVVDWEYVGFSDPIGEMMLLHIWPEDKPFLKDHPVDRLYCQLADLDEKILRWYKLRAALGGWIYATKDKDRKGIFLHERLIIETLAERNILTDCCTEQVKIDSTEGG
ncbi:phosphotransferase [Candidatus Poribacteria bacterium]|nr:phosphotransferase [Candidatus Poribacteria bacterium]